ncbi:MAG TPA: TolC family protein [Kofleriaceae bacterium]|nr:TolC family protein [Kofleriaceae bacterium]
MSAASVLLAMIAPATTLAAPDPAPPDAAAPATVAPRSITLREALAYARAHQPSLAAARARVEVARAQARLPDAARTPRIVAGAEVLVGTNNNTTASYGGPLGFDVPRVGGTPANAPTSWSPEPTTLVGAGLRQEIYDFGRLSAQSRALDLFTRAAEDDAELADLDLTLFVEDAFYGVAGAHAVLRASEAAVARVTAHRDLAQAGVNARLRPPIELTRAEADLARFTVDVVRARGALASAQIVLAAAIGAPDPALDAGADDVAYPGAAPLTDAMRDLDQRDPAIRAATATLEAQHALTDAIERELRPDLSLSAGITGRAGGSHVNGQDDPTGNGWLPDVPNWDAMVVLSWPIFDRTVDVRAEASRRLERVRAAEIDVQREALRGRAARAYADFQVADAALPALRRSLDAARANQAQADARFANGLATAIELADAEALLADAEIQLAIGQFQRARARAVLARVIAQRVPSTMTPEPK